MRVLLLNAYGDRRGGSQQSVPELAVALRARGHDVTVACPHGELAVQLRAAGIGHEALSSHSVGAVEWHQARFHNVAPLTRLLRRLAPDIVHTFQYGSYLLGRAVAGALDVAVVHTLLGPLSPGQRFASGAVGAIAPGLRDAAVAVGATSTHVVPNWIDTTRFSPVPVTRARVVLIVTRLDGPLCGIVRATLAAVRHLSDPPRVIVAGDGAALDQLRTEAPEVDWRGHVGDIRTLHATARVVVGVGRSLLEAMACGVPSVCVGRSGYGGVVTPETVERIAWHNLSGRHGPPEPTSAFVATLESLLSDDARCDHLRAFGIAYVGAHHSVTGAAAEFERVYALAIAARPTRMASAATSARLWLTLGGSKLARSARRWLRGRPAPA